MVDPTYVMHWHEEIPVITQPGARAVVHAGTLMGKTG
jgi:hypothetical protein